MQEGLTPARRDPIVSAAIVVVSQRHKYTQEHVQCICAFPGWSHWCELGEGKSSQPKHLHSILNFCQIIG